MIIMISKYNPFDNKFIKYREITTEFVLIIFNIVSEMFLN